MSSSPRGHAPLAGLVVVSLGASLVAMDLAVNVAFPSITDAFALEIRSIRWLVIFALAVALLGEPLTAAVPAA